MQLQNLLAAGWVWLCLFLSCPGQLARADAPTPEQLEFFEKRIRPVLVETCQKCHSTSTKQRGGLILDSREDLLRGGDNGPAVAPGHPEKSKLYLGVSYVAPDFQMPPGGKL